MAVRKPFRRTCRQFSDGNYAEGGRWRYLLHDRFAKDPRHYVRAFLLLQQDLMELFAYIEPSETNRETYSHRVHQLLIRTCIEVEANLAAILNENDYAKKENLTMKDYKLVNRSHRLSSFEVRIPEWKGAGNIRTPYSSWQGNNGSLSWYKAYNKSKHNRHDYFSLATFETLIDAMCGLVVLLSAQFYTESYSSANKSLSIGSAYSYDTNDGMESAIGGFFRVKFPVDWPEEECYDFNWGDLSPLEDPFDQFDYSGIA